MSQIRSHGMKPELAVRSIVHRLGYRFRLHRRDLPGAPDLVLPRHRAVIFVNGCFWHWHPDPHCPIAGLPKSNLGYWHPKLTRTRVRDEENTTALEDGSWRVLVVWECQLRNPSNVLETIHGFLIGDHISSSQTPLGALPLSAQDHGDSDTRRRLFPQEGHESRIEAHANLSLVAKLDDCPSVTV